MDSGQDDDFLFGKKPGPVVGNQEAFEFGSIRSERLSSMPVAIDTRGMNQYNANIWNTIRTG